MRNWTRRRWASDVSLGTWAGLGAGLVLAFGDFGASWLWLPLWHDRWVLGLRLLASVAPASAVTGALVGVLVALSRGPVSSAAHRLGKGDVARTALWSRRLWTVPFMAVCAPGAWTVGRLLFTGGSASKLPLHSLLPAFATVAMLAAVALAVRLALAVWPGATGRRAWVAAAVAFGAYFVMSKADQTVLPNLYVYLHGLLSVVQWALTAAGIALLLRVSPRMQRVVGFGPMAGWAALATVLVIFAVHVATLDRDQNVRVALFDPRASNSQSLMRAVAPLLTSRNRDQAAKVAAVQATNARKARQASLGTGADLPTWEGAHVVLITVDALRADHLGAYGYGRGLSPNIDALAKESVLFEHAYAQAPHSSYSLCSLMTSEYLHETVELGAPLPDATLANTLSAAGYFTAAFYPLGIFHTEGERLTRYHDDAFGFALHDHRDLLAEPLTDTVLAEADRVVAKGEPRTLFWVHYFDVHEPYMDNSLGTAPIDRYDGEIRIADKAIGRLLAGLKNKLKRDVVVVLTADHGEEFRDHGGVYHGSSVYEEQVHVPLLIHAPDLAARRVTTQVESVDIAPTVLAMTQVPVPGSMRGDDLRTAMLGRPMDLGPAFSAVISKRMAVRWPWKVIADLRFGLFELYNLEKDPKEHENLAGREPTQLQSMKGEVYAWLDSLSVTPHQQDVAERPEDAALARGRLGDRRSVPDLMKLLVDESVASAKRREAAHILGTLADAESRPALLTAMKSSDKWVAAECAIALGRMLDTRAHDALLRLVYGEDPDMRARAAVSLARLRDKAAVPGLIDALWVATTTYEREEAVRWLGRLRDTRAVAPLLEILPDFRLRHLTVIALGLIGDPRVYDSLMEMLGWESHTNIRDNLMRGIAYLGNKDAIPVMAKIAGAEPSLKNAPESLVRLGAIEAGVIGGADVHRGGKGLRGFATCQEKDPFHDWDYLERTFCQTRGTHAELALAVPPAVANRPVTTVLRIRRGDAQAPAKVTIRMGAETKEISADGQWQEFRWPVNLAGPSVIVTLDTADKAARLDVDHFLLIPVSSGSTLGE